MTKITRPAPKSSKLSLLLPLLLASTTALTTPAFAADIYWTGANGGDWFTAGSWSGGIAPTSSDNVTIAVASAVVDIPLVGATANNIYLGTSTDQGVIVVSSGGSLSAQNLVAGVVAGPQSEITVDGNGTILEIGDTLVIGREGQASLSVSNGAGVTSAIAMIGRFQGANGTVTVDGAGSSWTVSGTELSVGMEGSGSLNITDGGRVVLTDTTGDIRIGNALGLSSAVTVDGANSALTLNRTMYVGARGEGVLTISNGGEVTVRSGGSDSYVIAGLTTDSSSDGKIFVQGAGSKLDTDAGIVIGGSGHGELAVSGEASVFSNNAMIGRFQGGRGEVSIDGAGSSWNLTGGKMNIGVEGEGALSVRNFGVLSLAGNQGDIIIAEAPASRGSLTVDGSGAAVHFGGQSYVGNQGNGALTITNGGTVSSSANDGSNGYVIAGFRQGSQGSINVTGAASKLTTDMAVVIGGEGVGAMQVTDGGHVESGYGKIGESAGSSGDVTVKDANSYWQVNQALIVGGQGVGTLTIADNAQVISSNLDIGASGTVNIGAATGQAPGVAGNLVASNMSNNGQIVLNHTSPGLWLGGAMSGSGRLDARAGTTMLRGDSSAFSGTTLIASGATLQVGNSGTSGALGGSILNQGSLVFDRSNASGFSGSISGTGTVTKNGGGAFTLSGASSYSGDTTISAGTLTGSANSFGTGNILDNAALVLNQAADASFSNAISGSGRLTKTGAGNLTLTGTNSYQGGTTISAGTLTGSVNSFGTGNILDNAALVLDQAADASFSNAVSGSGRFTKTGAGNVRLTGINSYQGGTTISAGSLTGSVTGFGAGGIVNNAALVLNEASLINSHFGNVISGSGSLEKTGVGNIWLTSSANTYTGGTRISGGSLIGTAASFGSGDIHNDSQLHFEQPSDATFANNISGSGSLQKQGAGNLTLAGVNRYTGMTVVGNGSLTGTAASFGSGKIFISSVPSANASLVLEQATNGLLANVIEGGGTLIKTGSGNLSLTANSGNYGGQTFVKAGTVSVNTAPFERFGDASSAIFVSNGGILGGSGTIGGSVSIDDGVLAPGNSPGTLVINGNLSLTANSVLNYELGQAGVAGGALNDQTIVHGNLKLDGTLNVAQSAGGTYGAGVYRIISYDGALTDNGLVIGSAPSGSVNSIQTSIAGQVNLINTGGQVVRFWDGGPGPKNNDSIEGGSGVWTAALNGANSDNWTIADGSLNAPYSNGAFAVFGGTGGSVTIDNTTGQVQVSGMQFATDGYGVNGGAVELLSGSNTIRVGDGTSAGSAMTTTIASALQGAGGLNKTDLGTLVLIGTNTYTGGTIVSGGTLVIGQQGSIGGNVVNNAVLAFDGVAYGTTFVGDISGTGQLDVRGGMSLTLTGNNTFAGGTNIGRGTLFVGNGGITGSIVGDVHTDDGQGNGGQLRFNRSDSMTFAGDISGVGGVSQHGSGSLSLTGNNIYSGGTNIWNGTLIGSATSFGSGAINNYGALVLDQTTNASFANVISGAGSFNKTGLGNLSLTGNSSNFTGATTVTGGTLSVNGTLGDASSSVSVSNGGILGGSGTIGGSVSIADGVLAPGNSPGSLTINGNLALASNSTLNYELGQAGAVGGAFNDLTTVLGNLTLDGTINVTQSVGGTYGAGIYRIISYGGSLTDNGLVVGTAPSGSMNYVQTSVAHQVNLVNTQGMTMRFWDGGAGLKNDNLVNGGSGTWSAATSGANNDNWTQASGALNGPYTNGAFAVFQGSAGTVTVDNTAGQVQISGMQFATDGYTVIGGPIELAGSGYKTVRVGDGVNGASMTATIDSDLIGAGGVDKTDLGMLVLNGTNTYAGGTVIEAGTLIGSVASFGTGNIIDNATLVLNQAADAAFANTISGTGNFTKTGAGNLTLSGSNSYQGGTTISTGTLTGSTGSFGIGGIANNAALVLDQATNASFANVVSGTGTLTKTGAGDLTLSGANTYQGGTTISAGTLTGSAKSFGTGQIANSAALVIDQATDASFANALSGNGSFTKTGAGLLELAGNSSTFTGATTLAGGGLNVSGSIAGSVVTAMSGTTLSGSGTVGGVEAQAGAIIAPGNGLGTLTVSGNYHQASGSIYAAQVTPGSASSDLIAVNGVAKIDGGAILSVSKSQPGTFVPNSRYTLLTASGGVTGTYTVTGDTALSAFYSLGASYDATHAYLEAKQTRSFADAAGTPNQIATAGGLQSLPAGSGLRAAVGNLPTDAQARAAFDSLSGEIHSSIKGAMIDDSRFVRSAAIDRMRSAFDTVGAPKMQTATYGVDGLTYWSNGYGAWSNADSDGNAASITHNVGGFVAGADAPVFDAARFGLLAGYARSAYNAKDRNSSGKSDNYTLGAYGGAEFGNLGVRLGSAYTWSDLTTARRVGFSGFADSLSGKYNAGTFQAFGDVGYRIDLGSVSFEPFAGLAHVSVHTDGFSEQGGLAALSARSNDTDVTFTTLGLRSSSSFDIGEYALTATGSVAWRHALGDTTPMTTFSFAGSDPFGIAGLPIAKDTALIDLGLSTNLNSNVSLGVSYTGQFGNGTQSQGVRGNLNVKF